MDFYCRVKLSDGSFLMIEEVFHRVVSMEWVHENASDYRDGMVVFPAYGANEKEYELLVDLKDSARKALVRKEDGAVIFSGICAIR